MSYPKISKESASLCRIVNDGINRVSEDEHYKAIRLDVIQSNYGSMLYTDMTMLAAREFSTIQNWIHSKKSNSGYFMVSIFMLFKLIFNCLIYFSNFKSYGIIYISSQSYFSL